MWCPVQERTSYKAAFVRLRSLKSAIEHLQQLVEHATAAMKRDFETWRGSASRVFLAGAAHMREQWLCAHAGQGRGQPRTARTCMAGQRWPSWHAMGSLQLHRQHRQG